MRRRPFHKRLSEQTAQKRTVHLHHVWKIQIKHVANRLFHQWVIASDVENAVAAQKIEVRLVIHVVEIRALRSRIHLVEPDDALGCYERAIYVPIVQFIIFAKTRGNNLLQIESHEDENFRDSRSERKFCRASVSAPKAFGVHSRNGFEAMGGLSNALPKRAYKKAAGFRENPAAQVCEFGFA